MSIKNIKVGTLITGDMLEEMEACNSDVQVFKKEWPNGMRIRKKNLFRAAQLDLDVDWFAGEVFKGKEGSKYDRLFMEERAETETDLEDAALSFWEVIRERR